jgi:hypothetical protein
MPFGNTMDLKAFDSTRDLEFGETLWIPEVGA